MLFRSIKNRAKGRQNVNTAALATAGVAGGAAVALNHSNVKNNVMADRDGNVLRNNNGKWQQRSGGQWQDRAPVKRAEGVQRSSTRDFSGYNRSSSIDRQHYSRQRATTRTSRPSRGGGNRGGGRRR